MALMLDNCEGILLSLDSHKSVPAPFLTKTYQLVDDPSTDHIVSWGEDDTTFVVWRPPEFARDLLPNYFKHNNFSSFVRQLNTYGFRKIVPDRWEFANEYFKKGEKHLLCEIHRRKTSQPQVSINHHFNNQHSSAFSGTGFFPYPNRASISPPDSDDQANWCDSPPDLPSPPHGTALSVSYNSSVTALSEDNERLRRSNNMLVSELAHMRKLYNDIIYFVQNHVKPVAPSHSSSYPSSVNINGPMVQKVPNQFYAKQGGGHHVMGMFSGTSNGAQSTSVRIREEAAGNGNVISGTKLFGVPIMSKKRLHPEYHNHNNMETHKPRLVLEKDDLGLNLMPPSPC
ncbi:hypothetical protein LguiA_006640 [Lonicera macranthoides]